MKVVLMIERNTPKDEERNEKRRKHNYEVGRPYWNKLVEEKGIKVKSSSWCDNTGYMVNWIEFESTEDFAKIWDDEGWHKNFIPWFKTVDNVRIRLLRPAIDTSPKS